MRLGHTRTTLALLFALASGLGCDADPPTDAAPAPDASADASAAAPTPAFVDESACAECHAAEHAAWRGSHHDDAMRAVDETSLAGFDDVVFRHAGGGTTRFARRDGRPVVRTAGPTGQPAEFEVAYLFGVSPLYQLLLPLPGGRLQAFQVARDTRPADAGGGRWLSLESDPPAPPGDPLHWTGPYLNWNARCAECHSTNLRKRYDAEGDRYATTWSRIDVGCQACHGPGSRHLAWAERRGGAGPPPASDRGLVVDFASGDASHEIEQCARCHSLRHRVSPEDAHGRPFLDDFAPELLREGLYHADGQILGEVYVYGSFVQSRMAARGVRCTDCHDPHRAAPYREGDALCVRCHAPTPDPRFPTLAARRYDDPAHHHHPPESPGARCVACHMPERVYMEVDGRRDHGLRVPRPDLAVRLGTPDPCSSCHADRDAAWAARAVASWFPDGRRRGPHFAEVLHAARRGEAEAVAGLGALAGDAEAAPIVRATAVEALAAFGPPAWEAIARAAGDPEPLVRMAAAGAVAALPPADRVVSGARLLEDPLRAVRTEAAVSFARVPPETLPTRVRTARRRALAEYAATQRALRDTAEANLNLGALAEGEGELARAGDLYRAALRIDPGFAPARTRWASLLARTGRRAEAETLLREGLAHGAGRASLHYALGLLLAESDRLEEAAEALGRAVALEPRHARAAYNHGLALQQLGRLERARQSLERARALAPHDPDVAWALAGVLAQQEAWADALPHAESAAGERAEARPLLRRIRRELGTRSAPEPDP